MDDWAKLWSTHQATRGDHTNDRNSDGSVLGFFFLRHRGIWANRPVVLSKTDLKPSPHCRVHIQNLRSMEGPHGRLLLWPSLSPASTLTVDCLCGPYFCDKKIPFKKKERQWQKKWKGNEEKRRWKNNFFLIFGKKENIFFFKFSIKSNDRNFFYFLLFSFLSFPSNQTEFMFLINENKKWICGIGKFYDKKVSFFPCFSFFWLMTLENGFVASEIFVIRKFLSMLFIFCLFGENDDFLA